jgi:hypothetical protein
MPDTDDATKKACCMISEVLEEAGLDRAKARALRRQLLQGMILLCQWQLERLEESDQAPSSTPRPRARRARKVQVD